MAGVRRLGASRASIVSSAEPALTAAFAFAAFGDRFGTVQLARRRPRARVRPDPRAQAHALELSSSHLAARRPRDRTTHSVTTTSRKEPPMATPNVIRQPVGDSTPASRSAGRGSGRSSTLKPRMTSACRSRARRRATFIRGRAAAGLQAAGLVRDIRVRPPRRRHGRGQSAPRGEAVAARRGSCRHPSRRHATANRPGVGGAPRCQPTVSDTAHQSR